MEEECRLQSQRNILKGRQFIEIAKVSNQYCQEVLRNLKDGPWVDSRHFGAIIGQISRKTKKKNFEKPEFK